MTQVSFLRHGAFFGPEDAQNKTFCIIGAGATGSWAALMAAKMGWHQFQIWDLDLVESHNLPNQAYDVRHIGMKKVDALEQVLLNFNPSIQVEKHPCFFDHENSEHSSALEDYVFIAVDSLDTRKNIYNLLRLHPFVDIVFETRMGFTHAEINVLETKNIDQIDRIVSMLKTDSQVEESACNERIISTLVTIVASELVHRLCTFASLHRHHPDVSDTFSESYQSTFNSLLGKTIYSLAPKLNIYHQKTS